MRDVFQEALRLLWAGQPFVMATVVHTRGSTPQKPGARLLVRADGSGVGTLGGGCVEGDIWFAAKEALRTGADPQYRDYLLNEDIAARDGLVCGGSMYFYIEPVREASSVPLVQEIVGAYDGGPTVALATVVHAAGSHVQQGARLFVRQDGSTVGTLGDAELDRQAAEEARRVMPLGQTAHFLSRAGDAVYVEGFTSPPTLLLMGGGHVSRAIATMAGTLGFRIFVMDDRPEFASCERFPEAAQVAVVDYDRALEPFQVTRNTAIVVATRGHRYDDLALEAAARSQARYVGLIGSRRKVILIYERLRRRGIPLERVRQLHAPIGLDIGGRTPEEIAVSVVAEIVQDRYGATGRPMKLDEARLQRVYERLQRVKAASTIPSPP